MATLISAYAPTMLNADDVKDGFYEELESIITSVPQTDKLVLLGDFNARVGMDHKTWKGVIGQQGIGNSNSNGLLLLRTCASHNLVITNTLFGLPTRKKTSWMHPRSKHWHLLDYIITRQRDRRDVRITKAMCGAECWTDHRLILSKIEFMIQPKRRPQGQLYKKRPNTTRLNDSRVAETFSRDLDRKLHDIPCNFSCVEEQWISIRDTVYSVALDHLGPATKHHQDWFDENNEQIQALLSEKHHLLRRYQEDPTSEPKRSAFCSARKRVQKELRGMQDTWFSRKAEEI
jgi:hypothetical protein